jgi:surfeit locus 1 family protein
VTRRLVAFVALAIALGALFARLGVWQLDRRAERRAMNRHVDARLRIAAVPFQELARISDATNRRAVVSGTADFDHEIIVTGKSRNGSPGVHILTPVRVAGWDTAVIVNRGWVYSPDAATVDLGRWREHRFRFSGFTQRLPATESPAASAARPARIVRVPSMAAIARLLPYPVHSLYVVAQDSAAGDSVPVRLDAPESSDGPHLSYAIQWFAFAAIALIGAAAVVRRDLNATRAGAQLADRARRSG